MPKYDLNIEPSFLYFLNCDKSKQNEKCMNFKENFTGTTVIQNRICCSLLNPEAIEARTK